MSDKYYCDFCNEPIVDLLHMCEGKYDLEVAKNGTIGWSENTDCERSQEDIIFKKELRNFPQF